MELRLKVDSGYMNNLLQILKEDKGTDVAREAFTLLNWAANEVKKGRVIVSSNNDGTSVHRLAMPSLEKIRSE